MLWDNVYNNIQSKNDKKMRVRESINMPGKAGKESSLWEHTNIINVRVRNIYQYETNNIPSREYLLIFLYHYWQILQIYIYYTSNKTLTFNIQNSFQLKVIRRVLEIL